MQRRVVLAAHDPGRAPQRHQRRDHHDHARDVADRVVDADRRDAEIGLRGEYVGHVEHQRRADVVEHLEEDQRGAGEVAGHRQRKHDAPEQAQAARAEILRRLFHGAVDVGERDGQVEQYERKVVQRLDENHAVQPLHERNAEAAAVVEQQVDRAAAAEQQLHGGGADEGRHDQRQHAERLDQHAAAELEAHREIGERQRDDRGEQHAHAADVEAVVERLAHQRELEERGEMRERQRAVAVGERDVDDRDDRNHQEDEQKRRDRQRDRGMGGAEAAGHRVDGRRRRCESAIKMNSRERETIQRNFRLASGGEVRDDFSAAARERETRARRGRR